MYMYMYICIHIYTYIYIYLYVYICSRVHVVPVPTAGSQWGLITAQPPWAARSWHTSVVDAAGAIYVIGGVGAGDTNYNDVWAIPNKGRRGPCVITREKKLDGQNFFEAPVKPRRG